MNRKRALYCVVQYVPEGGRSEAANAGVVVFLPETRQIAVRTTTTLTRIRKFFAPSKKDLRRIELALAAFRHRMEAAQGEFATEDEFRTFVASRADAVRMTAPRLIVLSDVSAKLDELYIDLVGDGQTEHSRMRKGTGFPPHVAEIFAQLEAAGKVWRPCTIIVPETKRELNISLAYKNGKINYIEPVSLVPNDRTESRLTKLGFNGRLIYQHKINDEEGQLVVVSSNENASEALERRFTDVLDDLQVRFVPYAKSLAFAHEVEKAAH